MRYAIVAVPSVVMLASITTVHADLTLPGEAYAPVQERAVDLTVAVGGMHGFRSSLDDSGSVATTRGGLDTTVRFSLAERWTMAASLGYSYDLYDFGGAPFPNVGSTVDPWDDIHSLGFGALLSYRIDDDWTITGGGFGRFSGERRASWSDSFSGGGLASVTRRLGDRGIVGLGVGVTSAIEDSVKFFPVVVIDYAFSETLRVSTLGTPTPVFRNGIELVWKVAEPFELALGAAGERRRFRLNDRGSVADGIGEERELPVWLRASWIAGDTMRLDLIGGVVAWRELGIADRDGLRIDTDRVDPTPFVGVALRMDF